MFTVFHTTKQVKTNSFFVFLMLFLIFSSGLSVFAQAPKEPTDADLDNIIKQITAYTSLAQKCASYDCPTFDCEIAQYVFNNLRDARKYMRYTEFRYSRASETRMNHFKAIANEGKITSEQLEWIQDIVSYQEQTKLFFGMILDLGGALTNIKEIFEDLSKAEKMPIAEILLDLDKVYEIAKDAEQIHEAIQVDETNPSSRIVLFVDDDFNDIKSHISDISTILYEIKSSGGNLKEALLNPKVAKSRIALWSIIGRIAKSELEDDIRERKKYINSLIDDLNATDFTQSDAFNEFQRMASLKHKSGDAFKLLDNLIVIKSNGSSGVLTRCLLKGEHECSSLNFNYVSPIKIPESFQIFDIRNIDDHQPLQTGIALRFFNDKILNEVPKLLKDLLEINSSDKPKLELGKTTFEPNETFKANFTVSPCFGSSSWAGIVPTNISHGNESVNRNAVIGLRSMIGRKTSGAFDLKAPSEEGNYDIRLNNSLTGDEVKSISITVKKKPEVAGTFIKTEKKNYTHEESVSYSYAVQLEGNLQGKQATIILAEAGSDVQKWLSMSTLSGGSESGVGHLGKLESGSYEIRILLEVPPSRSTGKMFEDYILAKTDFDVKNDDNAHNPEPETVTKNLLPVPEGWAKGFLYNSNDGTCDYSGKYLVFMNANGGRFKNLRTGKINQYVVVAPGDKLEVAAPIRSANIRVFISAGTTVSIEGQSISNGTISQLVDGWWYQTGCKNGTRPATNCDNGNGQGPNTPYSCITIGED